MAFASEIRCEISGEERWVEVRTNEFGDVLVYREERYRDGSDGKPPFRCLTLRPENANRLAKALSVAAQHNSLDSLLGNSN